MKLIIDIPENVVIAIQNGKDYRYDIHTTIAQGIPYEERPHGDLISREALKKKLQARHDNGTEDFDKGYNIGLGTAIDLIDNAPTVEEKSYAMGYQDGLEDGLQDIRPQGEWITKGYEPFGKCNICGGICEINNYCGHCGADMRKGGAE